VAQAERYRGGVGFTDRGSYTTIGTVKPPCANAMDLQVDAIATAKKKAITVVRSRRQKEAPFRENDMQLPRPGAQLIASAAHDQPNQAACSL
jgi:hypothetical protein